MSHPKIVYYSRNENEYVLNCLEELRKCLEIKVFDHGQPVEPQVDGAEVIVDLGGGAPRPFIDTAKDARLYQVIATGLDHCEVQYILDKGIPLSYTPGFTSALGLSECVMMYILMLTRKVFHSIDNFQEKNFYQPNGRTLKNMTLAIIGFGASGREVARRAKVFGMRIEAIDVRPLESDVSDDIRPDFYGTAEDMDDVIARCDFLSLHLHLTPETHHILDGRRLSLMRPDAHVINVARGALIDEEALGAALLDGTIAGAGIDVFATEPADPERPEYGLRQMIVTPHISGQTDETVRQRCAIVVENVRRLLAGEEILYTVDASMGLGKK